MMQSDDVITQLGRRLKAAGVDLETALTISLRVRRPGGAEQMIEWLDKNPGATLYEICVKSDEIGRRGMEEELRRTGKRFIHRGVE